MASLTGQLVAETYRALLKLIDNDILTASEKQITDGFGGGSNVFIDSQGFLRANKYKVTNGLATQFLKADGSLDSNAYLTSITGAQVITALGYTPVPTTRTITINGETHNLAADNSWTVGGTAAIWGNITGTLSNQTDLQNALNAKFNNPTGTTAQYIRGDGTLATLPSAAVWGNITGTLADQTDLQSALNAKQNALSGTGFVKASGTTISYDNSTYLATGDAASTYQRLDKMVSNLLPSSTEYPNSNAVINALALKADALNPVFTGYMTISGAEPKLYFTDTDQNPDYFIGADAGFFRIYDQTAGATRFVINSSGVTTIAGDLIVGTIAKSGGTASQFLKADGSIDSNSYVTSASLANYLLISTAASTYQRLDKMVSNLLPSSTEYPNSQAVINALALKADAANPVFTGNMTISGAEPKLYFVDTDQNPDYTVFVDSGYFYIYDQTAGATRFSINSSGNINTGVGKSITAGSFIKESGTASQFLMADGSVSTVVANTITGSLTSGYIPKATGANTLGNSLLYENGTKVFIGTTTTNSISTGGLTLSNATSSSLVLYNGAVIGFIYGSSVAAGMAVSSDYDLRFETGDGSGSNWPERMRLFRSTGNLSLGNGGSPADSGYKLDVNGSVKFSNILDVSGNITLGNGTLFVSAGSGQSYSGRLSVVYSYPYIDTYLDSYAGASYESRLNFRTNSGGGAMSTKLTISNSGIATFVNRVQALNFFSVGSLNNTDGSFFIDHPGIQTWKIGVSNSNTSMFSIGNDNGGAFATKVLNITNGGNVMIGTTTNSGFKFDVVGTGRFTSALYSNSVRSDAGITNTGNSFEQILDAPYFTHGVSNLAFDVRLGNNSFWGYIQVEVTGTYSNQNTPGKLTKVFSVGTNPGGSIYNNESRIVDAMGQVVNNISIGDFQWDSSNSTFKIPISHIVSTGNGYSVRITMFTYGGGAYSVFNSLSLSPLYTLSALSRNYVYYNDRVGFGTTNPLMQIHSSKAGGNGIFVSNTTSNTGGYVYASTYTFQLQATDSANSSVGTLSLQPFGGNVLIGTGTDNGSRLRVVGGTIDFAGDTRYGVARIYNASVGDMFGMEQVGTAQTGTSGAATRIFTANSNNNFISLGWYTNATSFVDALKIIATGGAATFVSSVTATSFFESSDIRLKKLIESNPIIDGIEKLEAKLYEKDGKIELGYFAQAAELIMPYAVTKNADGFLNLSYREIHTAKIARLEKEVAQLKAQLNLN